MSRLRSLQLIERCQHPVHPPAFSVYETDHLVFAFLAPLLSSPIGPNLPRMRVVVQRVTEAAVLIEGNIRAAIGQGLLILAAFEEPDTKDDVDWMSAKIVRLRIFADEAGLMNRSVEEVGGGILLVSQFTLFASTRKGNRPSYSRSARPESAIPVYEAFIDQLTMDLGKPIQTGDFGAHMRIALINDGPVTILIDSRIRE
jgi:D-aminoacyl-tRNA deacylase